MAPCGLRRTRTCATWPRWTGQRSWTRWRITTSWPTRRTGSAGTCALARPRVRPPARRTPSTATSGDAAGLRITAREVSAQHLFILFSVPSRTMGAENTQSLTVSYYGCSQCDLTIIWVSGPSVTLYFICSTLSESVC